MPKIEEVKQLIFRHFHEQGVEVCINQVARGLQVQFYPWPSGNKIGNAVIIGRSKRVATGEVDWSCFPCFEPRDSEDLYHLRGFGGESLEEILAEVDQRRGEVPR